MSYIKLHYHGSQNLSIHALNALLCMYFLSFVYLPQFSYRNLPTTYMYSFLCPMPIAT